MTLDAATEPALSPAEPASPIPRKVSYVAAVRSVFESPDWIPTLVFATVCDFIPVLGNIALWGYYYEIVEALHRQPGTPYPKFEFRRFGEYCVRGVWSYVLATMALAIVQIFLQPIFQVTFQGGILIMVSNQLLGLLLLAGASPIVLTIALLVALSTSVLLAPMLLRAGLTQDFRRFYSMEWFKGYWRRVWVEDVLSTLFLILLGAIIPTLGCCVFGIGFFAGSTVVWLASAHIRWQIYEIYLERGGEPIPLHPLPAEAPPQSAAPAAESGGGD